MMRVYVPFIPTFIFRHGFLHFGNYSIRHSAKPCEICGDPGVVDDIITCCECKTARQHLYCMRILRTVMPPFWSCEECDKKKLVSPKPGVKKYLPEASTPKVSSLVQTSTRVSGGRNKNASASRFNLKERNVHTGRTKYISCEEAVKLTSYAMKSEQSPRTAFHSPHGSSKHMTSLSEKTLKTPQRERTAKLEPQLQQPVVQQSTGLKAENVVLSPRNRRDATQSFKSCRTVERTNTEKEMKTAKSDVLPPRKEEADVGMQIEVPKSSKILETANTKADIDMGTSDAGIPNLTRGLSVSEKDHPYIPALCAYWKGSFYLPNGPTECFDEAFKAHPPSWVHSKVYESLKKLPEKIHFELVPKQEVWMEIFPGYCPDNDDIGLYFFPRSKKCISMMELLWSKDLVMRSSNLDGVELLVLSSRLLQPHSQEFQGNYFLWGVFRCVKKKQKVVEEGEVSEAKHENVPPGFEKICKPQG